MLFAKMALSLKLQLVAVLLVLECANYSAAQNSNDCICTREYRPVCGSNGRTFSNQCTFNCEKRENSALLQLCNQACPCPSERGTTPRFNNPRIEVVASKATNNYAWGTLTLSFMTAVVLLCR